MICLVPLSPKNYKTITRPIFLSESKELLTNSFKTEFLQTKLFHYLHFLPNHYQSKPNTISNQTRTIESPDRSTTPAPLLTPTLLNHSTTPPTS
ncbi:hypothetical protein KC19_VG250900 [Ceratodon purpureus]|uniref:Uncharacterized protein n=1 Tax=Ceratodon purpureus TaxID=3225 RepID=A0A8T0HUZ3_CERPU|nr:hypothetical protein KC19_VG250900 [Ceratodon purpureus]